MIRQQFFRITLRWVAIYFSSDKMLASRNKNMKEPAMTNNKTTCECPKCCGRKYINGFGHIASGVCFMCGGSGLIAASRVAVKPAAQSDDTEINARRREWLSRATRSDVAAMTFEQLYKALQFTAACLACGESSMAQPHKLLSRQMETAAG